MKSIEELKAIRDRVQMQLNMRKEGDEERTRVVVGMATCGIAAGARPVLNRLLERVQEKNMMDVTVTQTGCIGLCRFEPIVEIYRPGEPKVTYVHMDAKKADDVVEKHLIGGQIVDEYVIPDLKSSEVR